MDHRRPDAHLNLAKACMLIALEEEAAIEDEMLQSGRDEITWLKVLSEDIHQQDSAEREQDVELHVVNRRVQTPFAFHCCIANDLPMPLLPA